MEKFILNEGIIIREDDKKVLVQQTGFVLQLDRYGLFILTTLEKNPNIYGLLKIIGTFFDTVDLSEIELQEWIINFLNECESLGIGHFE